MTFTIDQVRLCPAFPPRRLLELLATAAEKAPSFNDLTRVTVWLRNGIRVDGYPFRVTVDGGVYSLLLIGGLRSSSFSSFSFQYVDLAEVSAVEIDQPGPLAQVLSVGKIPHALDQAPLSLLELRRRYQGLLQQGKIPVNIPWDLIPQTDSFALGLEGLARTIENFYHESTKDEFGRDAWKKVHEVDILHKSDTKPQGSMQNSKLVLSLDIGKFSKMTGEEALFAAINSAL